VRPTPAQAPPRAAPPAGRAAGRPAPAPAPAPAPEAEYAEYEEVTASADNGYDVDAAVDGVSTADVFASLDNPGIPG